MSLFQELVRPNVRAMDPYAAIVPFEVLSRRLGRDPSTIIKLDANENPYGPSPRVRERLAQFPYYHIYPDPQQEALRAALSEYVHVPADHIFVGHGADEIIDLLCRLFLRPGDAIINAPPTFGMYEFDAQVSGGEVVNVWRDEHFRVDVAGLVEAVAQVNGDGENRAKLLFLTTPNNPDGSVLDPDALRVLLELPVMVVVDEAYFEFSDQASFVPWVLERENLIVLRTFAKWAGLAGLRLGYGVFPLWVMDYLWRIKQPYNVNVAATVAGLTALEDRAYYEPILQAIKEERERLYRALQSISYLHPYPSQGNFILVRVEGRSARELQQALAQEGILVRYFDKPGLHNSLRISVGKPEHTDALVAVLREFER
ncbi:MAG: histidinol-phosphate transaminase [Chloroflexi bacterium]|nr:histidinol-phosphate transaminase [Chloroflexota bacterium]